MDHARRGLCFPDGTREEELGPTVAEAAAGVVLPGEEAARIAVPTLLLWCEGDRVIDASAAALYRDAVHGSRVRLLQGCNHMPMMERPDETAAVLEEFLR